MQKKALLAAALAAVVTVLVAASIHAFPLSRYNKLTFNRPVALPGVTLAAGVYRFEVADGDSTGNVVRVSDASGRIHYTGFTIRVPRPHDLKPGETITFGEGVDGAPPPIRVWFPLDLSDGRQFRY
jgi:hypothetical protein